MRRFESDFAYGRVMLKRFVLAAVIACAATLFTTGTAQIVFMGLTVICFAGALYMIFKYCRCPNCGKVIFFGVLALSQCPRCKRNLFTGQKMKKAKK